MKSGSAPAGLAGTNKSTIKNEAVAFITSHGIYGRRCNSTDQEDVLRQKNVQLDGEELEDWKKDLCLVGNQTKVFDGE